MDKFREKVGN